jgi:CheY-like chemotaxis protein
VDLNASVEAACPRLDEVLTPRHDLVLRLARGAGTVSMDAGELEQAIVHLVANARDAMPGGGRIEVETMVTTLGDGARTPHAGVPGGDWTVLAVRDAGGGMDEATRTRALEPFFTTKAPGDGSGLGLAIVYGIVEQAGGRLVIDTAPGRGTVVRLYLPPGGAPARAPVRELPRTTAEAGSETVLLAEDDPSLRLLCHTVLATRGYALLDAGDGAEALAVADAHDGEIHLLVTDIVMPGMGGPELYRQLAERRPGVRVLFTSGYPQRELTPSEMLDRENFLPKPYTPAELARRVRALLDDAAVS